MKVSGSHAVQFSDLEGPSRYITYAYINTLCVHIYVCVYICIDLHGIFGRAWCARNYPEPKLQQLTLRPEISMSFSSASTTDDVTREPAYTFILIC